MSLLCPNYVPCGSVCSPCVPCGPIGPCANSCCPPRPCKSRELRGGVLIPGCHCTKRNGLQDNCPRWECQVRVQSLFFFFCDFENPFIRVGKSPENLICRHPFFPLTFSILKFIVLIYRVEPVVWLSPCQIAVHLNTCGGFNIGWWENRPTLQHRAPSIQSAVVVVIHALWPALVPSQGVHRALIHPVHRCLAEEALALPVALVIRVVLALNAPQCQLATLALVAK